MKIIIRVLLTATALLLAAYLLPGIIIESIYVALLAALVLGALNLIARPILVLMTLPITVLTLGLFIFVINALLFLATAAFFEGFVVDGFLTALLGSIIVSVVSAIGNTFIE